jgi:hypothetical protein
MPFVDFLVILEKDLSLTVRRRGFLANRSFGMDPSVEKHIDPANIFFVMAFRDDSSRNRGIKGIRLARRGVKLDL